jgi:hypothetical protein
MPPAPAARLPRALLAVLALALALTAAALAAPSARAADEPVQITDGTVRWGVKASFRGYAGNGTVADGATQGLDGIYAFPIESGSYDAATGTTTVQARGTVHWQSHWHPSEPHITPPATYTGPLDIYVLDITIRDPRITISADGSELTVDAVSRSASTWEMADLGRISMVELDASAVTPVVDGGVTSWSGLPATITEPGANGVFGGSYVTGQAVDPVAFSYTGPGGAPDFSEHWTAPDSNGLAAAGNDVFGTYDSITPWWVDGATAIAHRYTWIGTGETTVSAFDLRTGQTVGTPMQTTLTDLVPSLNPAFRDTTRGVVYYSSAGTLTVDRTLRWNTTTKAYETATITPFAVVANGLLWDAARDRAIGVVKVVPSGASSTDYAAHEWYVATYTRQSDGGIVERRYRLPDGPSGWNRRWYDTTMTGAAIAADGSLVLPRGPLGIAQTGVTAATIDRVGTQRIVLDDATATATVTEIPGSDVAFADVSSAAPDVALANAHGDVTLARLGLISDSWIRQYRLDGGQLVPVGDVVTPSVTRDAAVAMDPVDGTVWHLDNRGQRLDGIRGGRLVFSRSYPYINTVQAAIGTLPDRTVWLLSNDGNPSGLGASTYGYARFTPAGYSPTVTTDPTDETVTVEPDGHASVTFTAAATGTPAPSVRWQRRAPGSTRFADVAGATTTTLQVDAGAADDGAAYRAVFANDAGTLATEPAALTVRYRPQITFDLASVTANEGADARLSLQAVGSPAPDLTWQRRVNGFWQTVDPADGDVEVQGEGNVLVVHDVNAAMDGAQFRVRLANGVGTTYSRTATLTVAKAITAPVTVRGGHVDWGFAERWRCYVVGNVAHGGAEVSGGVLRNAGTLASGSLCAGANAGSETFRFPVTGGSYDPTTRALTVTLGGTVRFWGHKTGDGAPALDTTFTNLRLEATGDAGVLYADAVGATMTSPTPQTHAGVPLVRVDLAGTGPTVVDGRIVWSGAPTTLTAGGAEVFGSYPEGEPFDPIALSLSSEPTATPDPEPQPEAPAPQPVVQVLQTIQQITQVLPAPATTAAKATVARVTRTQTLSAKRLATVARVTCPPTATKACTVSVPKTVRVTVGGRRATATVVAAKTVRAGTTASVRVRLPSAAAKRLAGRKATVKLTVAATAPGTTAARRTVTATITAKARR